jgi:predicted amidohydrolase
LRVFDTALGKIGILIGYDAEFPLLARAMTEAGAEVLLVPSCTGTLRGYWRVRVGAMARAIENQCIVVHAPTVGPADWLPVAEQNHGAAAIYGPPDTGFPEDGLIAIGKPDTAGWVHGEVALEAVREARADGTALSFRDWAEQPGFTANVETVALGAPGEA